MAMVRSLKVLGLALAVSVSTFAFFSEKVAAQSEPPTVSAVTLHVVPGQGGQEMVITPKGMMVPLPGPGVNGNVVQIYIGSQGGYWYVDRNGQQFDLTEYVARFQSMQGGAPTQPVQTPQYAPAPVQVNNYESSSSSGSSSSGGSGFGSALAAGAGAFAGAALGSTYDNTAYWHGVPYGTPYHYANGSPVYVNRGGNTVNVDNNYNANVNRTNNVNKSANVNAQQFNTNVSAQQNNVMAQQQNWYNQHAKENSQQFQGWQSQRSSGSNPFVNSDARYGWANQQAGGAAAQQSGGRFGGAQGGGGRFGAAEGGGAEGGGGRFGGAEGGGGRFGGAEGGGRFGGAEGGGRFGGAEGGGRFGGGRRRGGR